MVMVLERRIAAVAAAADDEFSVTCFDIFLSIIDMQHFC